MTCCEYECNQGRDCPVRKSQELRKQLPVTMEDEPPFTFDWIATLLRDFFAALGFILMVGIIAFVWGYSK